MDIMSYRDDSIDYLSNNLCWFVGDGYPSGSLPSNFEPKDLFVFDSHAVHYVNHEEE